MGDNFEGMLLSIRNNAARMRELVNNTKNKSAQIYDDLTSGEYNEFKNENEVTRNAGIIIERVYNDYMENYNILLNMFERLENYARDQLVIGQDRENMN